MRKFLFSLTLCTLLAFTAQAQHSVSSGTGFFISKSGYIITNQHVVNGCNEVTVRGAVKPITAEVIKTDRDIDLALLKARTIPPRVAPIREEGGRKLQKGDRLLLIGYPEKHGISGQYKIERSKVIDVKGPLGSDKWVQFEDAARQGNSGGPLLDESGNVVGVIVGKTETVRTNVITGIEEIIARSDIAINLPYLWQFLSDQNVQTVTMTSALQHGQGYLENTARDYTVNIHCAANKH